MERSISDGASTNTDQSSSRGREAFQSSGRGGAGNIRRSSVSSDNAPEGVFTDARGREHAVDTTKVLSTGRGGAGNLQSLSRSRHHPAISKVQHPQTASIMSDHAAANAHYEREVLRRNDEIKAGIKTTGRGGLGNISQQKSRPRTNIKSKSKLKTRSRLFTRRSVDSDIALHPVGRGGTGNIKNARGGEHGLELGNEEMAEHHHDKELNSRSRGGIVNFTSPHSSAVETLPPHQHDDLHESSGQGQGQSRSPSRQRAASKEGRSSTSTERRGLAGMLHKVTRSGQQHEAPAVEEDPPE
ncbi:hypothetical protein PLICRDRAFT_56930 [Plicaturopsis crispa FD-325 SS-3]|nr:hypothetical protein PLICRDRAFT_56930 [Plicaturopsis crispa FD-325 SS-3]